MTEPFTAALSAALAAAPSIISIVRGPDHIVELVNDAYVRLLPTARSFVGKRLVDARPELRDQGILEILDRVFATGEPFAGTELPFVVDRAGVLEKRIFTFWYKAVRDQTGAIYGVASFAFDVTEQVEARARAASLTSELVRSEERFRTLAVTTSTIVFTCDARGVPSEDSPTWRAFTGMSLEDYLAGEAPKWVHDDDRAKALAALADAVHARVPFASQLRIRRHDGVFVPVALSAAPLLAPDGRVREWVGTLKDVSAERDAEGRRIRQHAVAVALSKAVTLEAVSQVILDDAVAALGTPSGVVVLRKGDDVEVLGATGYDHATVAEWQSFPLASDTPICEAMRLGDPLFIDTTANLGERYAAWRDAVAVDGAVAVACVPLFSEGRAFGALGLTFPSPRTFSYADRENIVSMGEQCAKALERAHLFEAERTARDAAERARTRLAFLAEASELLATSLDYATTLTRVARLAVPGLADFCTVDLLDERTGLLRRVAVAHKDPAIEALARAVHEQYPHDPSATAGVVNVIRTGVAELYSELRAKDLENAGRDPAQQDLVRDLRLESAIVAPLPALGRTLGAITFVYANSGRRYSKDDVVIAEDLARRAGTAIENARLFEAEQSARESAERANRTKDDFLATISHELRTPLNAMLGWSRMLRSGSLPAERHDKAIEAIERNAVAQSQLIEDLLDVSRIISGKMRLDVQPVDLTRIVEAAIDAVRPAIDAKGIRFTSVVDPDGGSVVGDGNRLQQVLWNLLSNAVKFTPKGGRVVLSLERVNSHIEVTVSDTGEGIAPDVLPQLFQRFHQGDASITRVHGGLGLGLAICRHIVELHGGNVVAQSQGAGKGSTFTVSLPCGAVRVPHDDVARHSPRAPLAPTFESPPELLGLKVLLVDDEPDARELVATILEECGAHVSSVASAADALARVDASAPDVILSDIGMPNGDGYSFIRDVRALPSGKGQRIPAAALTAYARAEDRRRALMAGFQMHVTKPVEPAELVAVVANLARIGSALR